MAKIVLFFGKQNEAFEYHWLPITFPLLVSRLDLNEVEVVVIDERIEKEKTIKLIDEHVPGSIFFGISSSTGYQLARSIEMGQYVKGKFSEIPIVWGGAHVSALPEQSLQNDFVDVVVVGRGDEILPRLIEGIKKKELEGIPGVYWKKDGGISGRPNVEYQDIDTTPRWPYHILKIENYINPQTRFLNMTTSWGCENRCTFCYWYRNYNPFSTFSPRRVLEEVTYFKERYRIRGMYFLESDYFGDRERALEIARLLKGLDISYRTNSRISHLGRLTEKEFRLLEESGCFAIHVGLESGSPRMLKIMNKNISLDDMLRAAKHSSGTNITFAIALLFQIPGEEIEDIRLTYDYVSRLKEINPNIRLEISSFIPLPELPLTRLAVRQGYNLPKDIYEWSEGLLVKKNEFEKKPWMDDDYSREYEKVMRSLFPESQSMSEVHERVVTEK